jgi:hypothetical protein
MTSSQSYEGACHCRAIGFRYRTALVPRDWVIRACQCTFCRAHAALSTSDPAGRLEFVEHAPAALQRYQFGQRTADFLLCRSCGVYVGATMRSPNGGFGIINVRVLLALAGQLPEPKPMTYEAEGPGDRAARRERRWTPLEP